MKKLLVLSSSLLALHSSFAASDYEPFANATFAGGSPYTVGQPLCSGFLNQGSAPLIQATNATGGVWGCVSNQAGAAVAAVPVITNVNLSYPGLGSSFGNAVFCPPVVGNMGRMTLPFTVNSSIAYYSLLLKVTDVSTLPTNNTANFFAGFQDTAGAQRAAIARAQAYVAATRVGSSGYVLGVGKNTPTVGHTVYEPATNAHNVGDTLFIVVSYDYSTAGHPASLWVNPPTNSFGLPTPNVAPTLTTTNGSGELQGSGIVSFVLGCFTAPPPGLIVDDLRVGLTWDIVTGAPQIQIPPASQTTNAGMTATFSVYASGGMPLSYQWLRAGTNLSDNGHIAGSSTATLSINNSSLNDADNYSVIVSNAYGSVTTSPASLSLNDPAIDVPPSNLTLPPGATAVFHVVAGGLPTLTYGWTSNGVFLTDGGRVSGSQTANLTIANITYTDAAAYAVYVTNSLGSVAQSTPGNLSISDPSILTQPTSVTNNYGTTAMFQVTAAGSTSLSYQWQEVGVGALSDGGGITGSHSATLTLSGVSYLNAGSYYATVTDTAGSTNSATAALTVIEPIITSQPSSLAMDQGTTAIFNVSAIGAAPVTYKWSKNGSPYSGDGGNITGSQTASLTVSGLSGGDAGTYAVTVTDASGMSVTSTNVVLTVATSPVITGSPNAALTVAPGATATFAVGVSGTTPFSYQWYSNNITIAGATNSYYAITNVQLGMAGSFSAIVTNRLGTAPSTAGVLTVVPSIHLYSSNLVVVRVGDGADPLDFTGASMFLDQYTTNGTYLNSVWIPDYGTNALVGIAPDVNGGTITGTELSLSEDGLELILSGYNVKPPSGTLYTSTANSVPRGVGMVSSLGHFIMPITDKTAFSGTYYRGATSDGTNDFWGAGNAGGTYYFGKSASNGVIQSDYANLRTVNIFGGNLYTISGAANNVAVLEWTGLPTSAVEPTPIVLPIGTTPTDMAVNSAGTILYLGTSTGILRYDWGGSYWLYSYTIPGYAFRYLTVDFSQSTPIIYGTTSDTSNDHLVRIVDNNGSSSVETVLVSAGYNQNLRGIRFGPGEPYFNNSSDGNNIILNWNGRYTLQSSTNVDRGYTDIPTATSPYTNAYTNASQVFFRLRQ